MEWHIDNVNKQDRPYFKREVIRLGRAVVKFNGDKAYVMFVLPYIITETEDVLSEKSKIKKAFLAFLDSFRMYQFNQ